MRREILAAISDGRSRPGDMLPPEKELIERFHVARPTMREAMRILEVDGLVEFRVGARGGAFMRLPSVDIAAHQLAILLQLEGASIVDVWELQACVEPVAARMVANAPTEAGIAILEQLTRELGEVTDDHYQFSIGTAQFSAELMRQSGNPTFLVMGAILHRLDVQPAAVVDRQAIEPDIGEKNRRNNRSQKKLVRLIEAGDADGAETYWHAQLKVWRPYLIHHLRSAQVIGAL
ncbi:MAG: hypothetical protein JWN62_227 [Acidimicrobiales bacterium]|nr:hypothetical protein [Acidimicrobiales bacterium]